MKQKFSILLVVTILLCSLFCTPQASAVSGFIGEVKDPSTLPAWADKATLRRIVKNEYKRMIKLKSTVDNGVSYFDYGQTTDDWMECGQVNGQYYLFQTFVDGNSTADDGLEEYKHVSFIIVTEESYAKGEAYTLRDSAVEELIARAGMGSWGLYLPTSNQYWVGDKAYQSYQEGILETDYAYKDRNGNIVNRGVWRCYDYSDGYSLPTTGTEERYAYAHKGDVDEDNGITVADVVALRQYIVNPDEATATQRVIMDMDGDFAVTVTDVVALRQKIVNG